MEEKDEARKEKPLTIEVLVEGPGGELFFQSVEATPEHLEELLKTTKNSVIKHNLQKQIELLRKVYADESSD